MIKLLCILPNLNGGGAERMMSLICNNIDQSKFKVKLLLLDKKGVYLENLNSLVSVDSLESKKVSKSFFKILNYIKKEQPDIVFSTLGHMNCLIALLIPFFRKKIKFIARESNIVSLENRSFIEKLIIKIMYKNFDVIISQSDDMTNDLKENWKIKDSKIKKINNFSDKDFLEKKINEELSEKFSEEKINLISVGRLSKQKRFDKLIESFKNWKNEKDYHLYILGEGEEELKLKELAYKLKLSEKISFLGFQKNPYKYLKNSDVYILSSDYEGFPNVLLEANLCGIPILTNNCKGGINEIVENGVNGYIRNISDINFYEKINELLEMRKNPNHLKEYVDKKFNKKKIIKEYENIFEKVVKK